MDFIKETKKLWDIYFFGNNEECTELLDGAMPDCVIIGTGKHEICHSRDSFFEALITEVEERKLMKFDMAFKHADYALYEAKRHGKQSKSPASALASFIRTSWWPSA